MYTLFRHLLSSRMRLLICLSSSATYRLSMRMLSSRCKPHSGISTKRPGLSSKARTSIRIETMC